MKKIFIAILSFTIINAFFSERIVAQNIKFTNILENIRKKLQEQGIDPDNKKQVMDSLYSLNKFLRLDLYNYCGEAKIVEVLPILKSQFQVYPFSTYVWADGSKSRFQDERTNILWAVMRMKADGFQQEFRIGLDSLKEYLSKDDYKYIAFASYLMENHQDDYGFPTVIKYFTTKDKLFDFHASVGFLRPFYKSSHKGEVVSTLRYIFQVGRENDREYALRELKDVPDPQYESYLFTILKNDTSSYIRETVRMLLGEIKSSYYLPSLIDGLQKSDNARREWYYDELLRSGQVWAYKYVFDLYKNNTYPADHSVIDRMLEYYGALVEWSNDSNIVRSIDSLMSSTIQLNHIDWLKGQYFIDELNNYLSSAKNKLNLYDSIGCARQIIAFHVAIEKEFRDSINNTPAYLTLEGWKILHYNSKNILYRLPQIPVESAADMLDTLSTRLEMSYSNNWIGNQTFEQKLAQNIQNAKSKYTAKDSIGCAQEIENFYKLVRLKYIAQGTQFVKAEAYNLLYNYAREITGKVIVLPTKSNVSLIDQITALRTQIRTEALAGQIGGELLIRGLESSLDIAKQKLQKPDSTSSALYITLFQQTVRQTYEIAKKYPASRIYVKAGGYISLYYRAEYILEHLTIPIGQPMPKMGKELEEELGKYRDVSR